MNYGLVFTDFGYWSLALYEKNQIIICIWIVFCLGLLFEKSATLYKIPKIRIIATTVFFFFFFQWMTTRNYYDQSSNAHAAAFRFLFALIISPIMAALSFISYYFISKQKYSSGFFYTAMILPLILIILFCVANINSTDVSRWSLTRATLRSGGQGDKKTSPCASLDDFLNRSMCEGKLILNLKTVADCNLLTLSNYRRACFSQVPNSPEACQIVADELFEVKNKYTITPFDKNTDLRSFKQDQLASSIRCYKNLSDNFRKSFCDKIESKEDLQKGLLFLNCFDFFSIDKQIGLSKNTMLHFLFKKDLGFNDSAGVTVDWSKILELNPNPYIKDAMGNTAAEIFSKANSRYCTIECKNQFKNYIESYPLPK